MDQFLHQWFCAEVASRSLLLTPLSRSLCVVRARGCVFELVRFCKIGKFLCLKLGAIIRDHLVQAAVTCEVAFKLAISVLAFASVGSLSISQKLLS